MTFIDVICALLILGVFLSGFSQALLPAWSAWNRVTAEYHAAQSLHFIAESFRAECAKPDRNMEKWSGITAAVKEPEISEIIEIWQGGILRCLKAVCISSGERIEIMGVCTP